MFYLTFDYEDCLLFSLTYLIRLVYFSYYFVDKQCLKGVKRLNKFIQVVFYSFSYFFLGLF
jgi:hypothetical protein